MHQFVRNAFFNVVATIVALVTGLATSIVAARLIGPSAFGEFSFVTWLFVALVTLIDPGASSATVKFVSELEGSNRRAIGNSLTLMLLTVSGGVGLLVGLGLVAFSVPIANLLGRPPIQPYLVLIGFGTPVALVATVLQGRVAGFQRYDSISAVTLTSASISLFGTVVLLGIGYKTGGLVALILVVQGVQVLMYALLTLRMQNLWPLASVPRALVGRVLRYCLGVFVTTSCNAIIWQRSETFFLGRYGTSKDIAYYGIAYTITGALMALPAALTSVLMPAFSRHFGAGNQQTMQHLYARATKYVAVVALPLGLGTAVIATPLMHLLYGEQYLPSIGLLRILMIAGIIGAVSNPGSGLFQALGKTYHAAVWNVPIALLDIVFASIFVPHYGALGAAVVNSLCQGLVVLSGITYLIRYQKYRFPFIAVFKILLSASFGVVFAYLAISQIAGITGLILGVTLAALLYVPGLVAFQALDALDFSFMRDGANLLPRSLSIPIGKMVDWMQLINTRIALHLRRD